VTSIERTAYPEFKRLTSARVLHVFFTPTEDEAAWAQERTETPESLLALLVDLKCFQRMARFCAREEIPDAVTDHVRHCLGLAPETEPDHGTDRTMRLHRGMVRTRQGATRDPQRARALAAAAIRDAAQVRNHPPDLINVALERIIEASLELPAYSTLDNMATTIRAEVNEAIFAGITARMGPEGRQRAQGLLDTAGSDGRSMFNRLKKPAKRATWSRFKAQAEYLDEVDALGDTACWVEGVAPSKVADFAGEAAAQDIDTLSRYGDAKKLALVACLAHTARMQARDDLAEMLCKRVASIVKKAKTELEEIRLRQRAVTEQLIGTYRTVLENLDPDGEAVAGEPGQGPALAVAAVEEAGGFAAQMRDIEEVTAYHGDNRQLALVDYGYAARIAEQLAGVRRRYLAEREHNAEQALTNYRCNYVAVSSGTARQPGPDVQGDPFGGHEFEYESTTDLFRCTECRQYEIVARKDAPDDLPISPCPGWRVEGDPYRAYLLVTDNPEVPEGGYGAALANKIGATGLGRTPRYSWRDGRLLVQSAPSVVDDLARRIRGIRFDVDGREVPAVSSVERISVEAAQDILAENYAAYAAKWGEPA
jgi:hypothetical protein